jgi:hypothetical protein
MCRDIVHLKILLLFLAQRRVVAQTVVWTDQGQGHWLETRPRTASRSWLRDGDRCRQRPRNPPNRKRGRHEGEATNEKKPQVKACRKTCKRDLFVGARGGDEAGD